MPEYSKTNTTSQSTLRTIKLKLQGRCHYCSGKLPHHIGVCPVYGQELQEKFNGIDSNLKNIDTIIEGILEEHKRHV